MENYYYAPNGNKKGSEYYCGIIILVNSAGQPIEKVYKYTIDNIIL